VLNRSIPGRPESPVVPIGVDADPTGFAAQRLYRVPPAGQHPRILFSADDLPRIRQQLAATPGARALRQEWQKRATQPIADPAGWLAVAHAALVAGDVPRFQALWVDPRNPLRTGPPGAGANPLTDLLFYRAFEALLADDARLGRESAAATVTYARWLRPQLEAAARQPGAEHFWLALRPVVGDSAVIGYLYDFTHAFMAPPERAEVQALIGFCTQGRYTLGMDLPPHWRNWNHIGMGLYFSHLALAIEGEPGSDPRHHALSRELTADYLRHSNTANGVGKEGMGYHTAGLSHAASYMLALANRGENLFALQPFRRMFSHWMLWTLQPWGKAWSSNGDLGTFPPNPGLVRTMRWLFPEDPAVRLVAGQLSAQTPLTSKPPEVALLEMLCPAELGEPGPAATPPAFPAGLPLHFYEPARGVLFTKTSWDANGVSLQFNARSDTTFPSHDHADRGDFFLSALGQAWSVPAMRETESQYHSVITVDGVGQGYFAPPATWLECTDTPAGTTATVDLKYCYDWRWMKSSFLATDEQLKQEPWLEWVRESRDRLLARAPRNTWERDPLPQVRDYFERWQAGDPRMWDEEDAWILRGPNLPVRKAFRSIALVRGEHPFVVIADDIRVDDAEHLYEWRMILPMSVEAHDISRADLILGPLVNTRDAKPRGESPYKDTGRPLAPKGTPLLLVRILEIGRPTYPERTPNPAVETVEFLKHDDMHQFTGRSMGVGRRLVLPSRSVEPRYRVLLFPYRAGEALPVTKWESPDTLAVTAAGRTARVRFAPAADGSTRLSILP
jgi:hypothetical protein